MTEAARVRISKVRLKTGGGVISVLPTRPAPDDTNFVPTLVWVLGQARRGKIAGYALVFILEEDDVRRTIESAVIPSDGDEHHLLGAIRRMELNFMRRTWGEE